VPTSGSNIWRQNVERGRRLKFIRPPDWTRPRGYSNGVLSLGRTVYLAGIVGWNKNQKFETSDFAGQFRQLMINIVTLLKEADAKPEHIVNMTWYVADKHEYSSSLNQIDDAYHEIIGAHYPAMTIIEVNGFVAKGTRLEIETTAVIPYLN